MRIALRTGAGRGAYELAGRQGEWLASDLFAREIFYEITPDLVIPGRSVADVRQGKPRIVLDADTRKSTTHAYRLLSAIMLLPKPKRELRTAVGPELLSFESYSMTAIKVDVAHVTPGTVTLRPTDLLLENANGLNVHIDVTARMARIVRLWNRAALDDAPLSSKINQLVAAIRSDNPDYKLIESASLAISDALYTQGDLLPSAERALHVSDEIVQTEAAVVEIANRTEFGAIDDLSPQEALIQRLRVWRLQSQRGASAKKFGRDVSAAYDFRCLFSGQKLPRLETTSGPGVDAAHILPWASHNLDSVRNGVCLNKQCHWAFDQGVLRLDFDPTSNEYVVSLPVTVRDAAAKAAFDLDYFQALCGAVPRSRLPEVQSLWPSPTYIAELNNVMSQT